MQKESFEYGFLPFLSLLIYSNAYKLFLIHYTFLNIILVKKKSQLSKEIGQFRVRSGDQTRSGEYMDPK